MVSRTAWKTFRLATINVHSFQSGTTQRNNVNDLVSILKPLDLDLLAVEEVFNNESWTKFCQLLSLPYSAFDPTYGNSHGNGIASRYPIKSQLNRPAIFLCPGGRRSLIQCSLEGLQNVTFAVTHLDHINEDARLTQIKEFNPYKNNIDILMGDMNALTREDYSDKYYQNIVVRKRKKSQWEKPRFDLTKLITHQWNYQDAFKLTNPKLKDEQVATCQYGTRIDYIYIHPRVNDQWTLTQCSIVNTQPATDHNAVLAVFEQKSK